MTDRHVNPQAEPARLTYGDLWALADRMRTHHDLWSGVCTLRSDEARVAGNEEAAQLYGRAALEHTATARQFEAMQKLIGRAEGSKIIREEIKRMAEIERAESVVVNVQDSDHVEA